MNKCKMINNKIAKERRKWRTKKRYKISNDEEYINSGKRKHNGLGRIVRILIKTCIPQ